MHLVWAEDNVLRKAKILILCHCIFFALVEDISAFETSKALISGCILRIYFYLKYQHYFILGFVGLS
jgi:hypothetical protein